MKSETNENIENIRDIADIVSGGNIFNISNIYNYIHKLSSHQLKRIISFSVIFVVLIASFVILGYISFSSISALRTQENIAVKPEAKKPKSKVPLFVTEKLTKEQLSTVKAGLITVVHEDGPKVALEELAKLMEKSPGVLRTCHGLVHEIGRQAYRMYDDFPKALMFENDVCGSGYLHGVIEARFENVENIFSEIKVICDEYTSPQTVGKCYHGVGHGLMFYTQNDLPKSIELCNSFDTTEKKVRCGEGVFMENFATNQDLHPSIYVDPKDPLYPCAEHADMYQAICYYYAPLYYLSLHEDAYTKALVWCETAETGFGAICARGVGSRIMKQHIADPVFVETTCMQGPEHFISSCLDGMVSYHLVNFDSVSKAKEMCTLLLPKNQLGCFISVENRKGNFAD